MSERERLKAICKDKEYDVYVTTYEQFVAERTWFGNRVWKYVVVDEGRPFVILTTQATV
jgi:SNF2 family DNA or RNA helicase